MRSKAAQTKPKKLIRCTCPSGNGSDGSGLVGSGPNWGGGVRRTKRTLGLLLCISSDFAPFGIVSSALPNCKEISTNSTELRIDET